MTGAPTTRDRYRGALLGLAAGDALGTTLEFKPPGSFRPIDDMVGGGPFRLRAGEWTDDTSMALCLAASLIARQGFDAADQMRRYVRWRREGYMSSNGRCFDIGNTVRDALSHFERTGEPYAGSTDPNAAGNGSLMRLAPVPLYFAADARKAIDTSAESSRTTHGTREAVDACRYFGGLLVPARSTAWTRRRCSRRATARYQDCGTEEPLAEKVRAIANGSFKDKEPPAIRGKAATW